MDDFNVAAVERRKTYESDRWYHVWNRGARDTELFADDVDRRVFLALLDRYVGIAPAADERGREYESLRGRIELGTFCLMPTHFHLLLRTLHDPSALPDLLKRVKFSYARHVRRRWGGTGAVYEGRYRADPIRSRSRLITATAYVNLNHANDQDYQFSGHSRLVGSPPPWMNGAARLLDAIGGPIEYDTELRRMIRVRQADAARELRGLRTRTARLTHHSGLDRQNLSVFGD